MTRLAIALAFILGISGSGNAAESFAAKQCRAATDVSTCVVKLNICLDKEAERLDKLEAKIGPVNQGMASVYHCLQEQNVAISRS